MEVDEETSTNAAAPPQAGEEKASGKLHVLGIGGRRAKRGGSKATGTKKTPGEIRIQKGETWCSHVDCCVQWLHQQQSFCGHLTSPCTAHRTLVQICLYDIILVPSELISLIVSWSQLLSQLELLTTTDASVDDTTGNAVSADGWSNTLGSPIVLRLNILRSCRWNCGAP